ncbi:MAG: hypothetical protein WCJ97_05470 [Phycisphaerae bacterium]
MRWGYWLTIMLLVRFVVLGAAACPGQTTAPVPDSRLPRIELACPDSWREGSFTPLLITAPDVPWPRFCLTDARGGWLVRVPELVPGARYWCTLPAVVGRDLPLERWPLQIRTDYEKSGIAAGATFIIDVKRPATATVTRRVVVPEDITAAQLTELAQLWQPVLPLEIVRITPAEYETITTSFFAGVDVVVFPAAYQQTSTQARVLEILAQGVQPVLMQTPQNFWLALNPTPHGAWWLGPKVSDIAPAPTPAVFALAKIAPPDVTPQRNFRLTLLAGPVGVLVLFGAFWFARPRWPTAVVWGVLLLGAGGMLWGGSYLVRRQPVVAGWECQWWVRQESSSLAILEAISAQVRLRETESDLNMWGCHVPGSEPPSVFVYGNDVLHASMYIRDIGYLKPSYTWQRDAHIMETQENGQRSQSVELTNGYTNLPGRPAFDVWIATQPEVLQRTLRLWMEWRYDPKQRYRVTLVKYDTSVPPCITLLDGDAQHAP